MSHGRLYLNPRRRRGKQIPKEFRAEYKRLKAAQRKLFRAAEPIERSLRKLFNKIGKTEEKERGTKIEIGRPGKKAESINIGGIDLLKLVKSVEYNKAYMHKLYTGVKKCLEVVDEDVQCLEDKIKKLARLMAKSKKKS